MSNQFTLLTKKRFLPMFFTQFLGAFNDNFFKQALVLLLTYQGAKDLGMSVSLLNNLASLLFILPFFLFSSTAGQLADKFEKSRLSQNIKILEIIIMTLAAIGFIFKLYFFLLFSLFLMGTHSTFFGPVKYAYLPQALKSDELVGGNGLFQTGTSLSILIGMIIAGIIFGMFTNYVWWISGALLLIAFLGYLASRAIPNTPATNADLKVDWRIWRTTFSTVSYVKQMPLLFYTIIGISWYWFYGATFLTQTPQFTKDILLADESVVIFLLTLFSIGIAVGSLLCKMLTKGEVSLRLLPVGLVGLTVFATDLYFSLNQYASHFNISMIDTSIAQAPENYLRDMSELLADRNSWRVLADLTILGLFGGFYVVPLYAFMQAYAPASHRARVIAANNIVNAFFLVISAIFAVIILNVLKLGLPTLFVITGVINIFMGLLVWKKMKTFESKMQRSDGEYIG